MRTYLLKSLFLVLLMSTQTACVSTIVNAAVDTTIAVAKVPFKVAGAAVDVVVGDGKKDKGDDSDDETSDEE